MKAICLKQVYADLVAFGYKTFETRMFCPSHAGPILITSSRGKNLPFKPDSEAVRERFANFMARHGQDPLLGIKGYAIAVCWLGECREMKPEDAPLAMYDYEKGRKVWTLEGVKRIKPIPVKSSLNVFECKIKESDLVFL